MTTAETRVVTPQVVHPIDVEFCPRCSAGADHFEHHYDHLSRDRQPGEENQ